MHETVIVRASADHLSIYVSIARLDQERAKENEKSENDGMGFGLFD
jgi:hypothetical protein